MDYLLGKESHGLESFLMNSLLQNFISRVKINSILGGKVFPISNYLPSPICLLLRFIFQEVLLISPSNSFQLDDKISGYLPNSVCEEKQNNLEFNEIAFDTPGLKASLLTSFYHPLLLRGDFLKISQSTEMLLFPSFHVKFCIVHQNKKRTEKYLKNSRLSCYML